MRVHGVRGHMPGMSVSRTSEFLFVRRASNLRFRSYTTTEGDIDKCSATYHDQSGQGVGWFSSNSRPLSRLPGAWEHCEAVTLRTAAESRQRCIGAPHYFPWSSEKRSNRLLHPGSQ